VPVDVLSAAQIAGYGRYGEPPSARQLKRFFHFDDRDRERIADRRGDSTDSDSPFSSRRSRSRLFARRDVFCPHGACQAG
jgi:hypothetical protein